MKKDARHRFSDDDLGEYVENAAPERSRSSFPGLSKKTQSSPIVLNRGEIELIIGNGNWNRLKGRIEGDCLDCKEQIYDLNSDTKKIELAKDVSALANASGGDVGLVAPAPAEVARVSNGSLRGEAQPKQ